VLLEATTGTGAFGLAPWLAEWWEVPHGEVGDFPAARIGLRLGVDPRGYGLGETLPADWQVQQDDGAITNAWAALLTGRQVVIRTWRTDPIAG